MGIPGPGRVQSCCAAPLPPCAALRRGDGEAGGTLRGVGVCLCTAPGAPSSCLPWAVEREGLFACLFFFFVAVSGSGSAGEDIS